MQLRFASFAVINLRWDLHPQECAHAGRTKKSPVSTGAFPWRYTTIYLLPYSIYLENAKIGIRKNILKSRT
jgi:hypothetical protein